MTPTDIVKQAEDHARDAHDGAVDLAGQPYIEHVKTVVDITQRITTDAYTLAIAWLHDVVEDTDDTLHDFELQGYPQEVIDGVSQLTREKGYPYKQYIQEITDPRARIVKIADLLHNQDDDRLPQAKRNAERQYKYRQAIVTLVGDAESAKRLIDGYFQDKHSRQ